MRNRHLAVLDFVLLCALPFALVGLRFETLDPPDEIVRAATAYVLLAVPTRLVLYYMCGAYTSLWRYASMVELRRLAFAGGMSAIISFLIGAVAIRGLGLSAVRLPYSTLINDAVFSAMLITAPRLAMRALARGERQVPATAAKRVLIAGAGFAGQAILREMHSGGRLNLTPVGFVDDDETKLRHQLGGVMVLGTISDIGTLVPKLGVEEVIIAMPGAGGSVIRRVLQQAESAGVTTRTVPGMYDLISGRVAVQTLRKVEIQDLLRREPITTDLDGVRALVTEKVVLITGAGGSIGSELCRQISDLQPESLIILDHSENQVFEIYSEMRRRYPQQSCYAVIADIRDAARIRAVFDRFKPFAVFHAAAHKHVPLMEDNIVEAVTNNVLGTRNVVEASLDMDVAHFVCISTDKAVRPTSVMGVTKRIAESIVQHVAATEKRNFMSVRFGNVLGSRGSVIPTFIRQIEEGGPVTVTHPEMRRFFMTIPEAVQLVLQAGALGKGGELFVLDMGDPVKIVDLAKDLIRLSGLEEGRDIEIDYTGVRPGEKLYEEVFFGNEDVRSTDHPKVLRAISADPEAGFPDQVDDLIRRVTIRPVDIPAVRDALRVMVPDFAHEDARTNPKLRPSPPAGEPTFKRARSPERSWP